MLDGRQADTFRGLFQARGSLPARRWDNLTSVDDQHLSTLVIIIVLIIIIVVSIITTTMVIIIISRDACPGPEIPAKYNFCPTQFTKLK